MTPERWKTIKRWLEIIASILTVVGFVVNYWAVAVPFLPVIWKYGWPFIVAYPAFRIFQRGSSLYERFTKLELQVFGNAVDVDIRLDEQAKAYQDSLDKVVRTSKEELRKMSQKLDTVEEVLHSEFNERKKLEAKVIELEKRLSASQKVEPTLTLTERLMSSGGMIQRAADKKPQAERSLADMRPGGLLALGATPPKRKT